MHILWLPTLISLIKKKRKFSSYIRKCRWDRVPSHIWGNAQIFSHIGRSPLVIGIRLCTRSMHSKFSYIWGKFYFLFYQCCFTFLEVSRPESGFPGQESHIRAQTLPTFRSDGGDPAFDPQAETSASGPLFRHRNRKPCGKSQKIRRSCRPSQRIMLRSQESNSSSRPKQTQGGRQRDERRSTAWRFVGLFSIRAAVLCSPKDLRFCRSGQAFAPKPLLMYSTYHTAWEEKSGSDIARKSAKKPVITFHRNLLRISWDIFHSIITPWLSFIFAKTLLIHNANIYILII